MFLDKGNSVLYLSHQPPDLSSLESLFVAIWVNVVQQVNAGASGPSAAAQMREAILNKIYPTLGVEDLKTIAGNVQHVNDILKWLTDTKAISAANGRILVTMNQLPQLPSLPDNLSNFNQRLKYLIQLKLEAPGQIPVMNFLKPFMEYHLQTWINSAFRACQLTEGREYMVDVGRSKTSLDKDPRIMILDLDTGVDLKDSQWNEGLHQFLQLKHGCQLSLLNLKAVFISNISYFKEYPRIFGLTGTIGTESDREFLRSTYNVELLCMPLAQPKRFIEEEPLICHSLADWKDKVTKEALERMDSNQSLLVVCGTVQEAEVLYTHVKKKLGSNLEEGAIELYRRDYEEFKATETEEGLPPQQILIATNLAGRGTDIKLSDELRDAGGLHVILSYLPDNLRVEQQAFGRASRSGDPGSGRLIFVDNVSSDTKGGRDAIDLKILRDELEMQRVSDIHTYYQKVILKEEEVFKSFRNSFEDVIYTLIGLSKDAMNYAGGAYKETWKRMANPEKVQKMDKLLEGNFKEVNELIMYSMLDEWAYWLDRYSCHLLNDYRKSELGAQGLLLSDVVGHRKEEDDEKLMQEFMEMTWRYENRMSRYKTPDFIASYLFKLASLVAEGGVIHGMVAASVPEMLETLPHRIFEAYPLELIKEPAMITKVAKTMIQRDMPATAEKYLDKVISADKENMVALYYKLVCKLKKGDGKTEEFARLLEEVDEKLEDHRTRQLWYASTIEQFKQVGNQSIFVGDGYSKQKEVVVKLLDMHKTSLDAMVGVKALTAPYFANLCNEHVAEHLLNYFLEEGALKEAKFIWKEDNEKLRKLANAFCMEVEKVKMIFQDLSERELVPVVEKELKDRLDLPSRGGFWKEIKSCFEEVECFAVVQSEMGENETETNEWVKWAEERKGKCWISKYGMPMGADSRMQCILKANKHELLLEQKFRWLRKCGRVCFEKCAIVDINKLKNLRLRKYCRADANTFSIIEGITPTQSQKIIKILESSGIIDRNGELINVDEWTEKKPNLGEEFEVWRDDIWRVLHAKCRYKFELLHIISDLNGETNGQELKMSLPPRPCKEFVISAMELGFITGRQANPSYFPDETTASFLQDVATNCTQARWIAWVRKKTGLTGKSVPILTYEHLQKTFPEENSTTLENLCNELLQKEWVRPVDGAITKMIKWIFQTGKQLVIGHAGERRDVYEIMEKGVFENDLKAEFQYHQPELGALLQWRQEFCKENFMTHAFEKLYLSQGKLLIIENPDAKLVDIEMHFGTGSAAQQERLQCSQEINTFALNAFEHTIDTVERAYTAKMIFSAMFIAAFGLAQIALGLWLQTFVGAGTFVGSGFIGEGFGDIMYAYQCFCSGHFSWKDYATHKLGSVITTAMMVAIGALIAKGVKYSKYGEKIFGSWGKTMTRGEITGALSKPGVAGITQRSLFQEGLKSFGYKVMQAAALVGGAAAVTLAYEKALKQFVDTFSADLFQNTHEAIDKHSVSEQIGELVDEVGVERATRVVGQCRARVLETPRGTARIEQDAHSYLSQMLAPIMGGVTEALDKMASAEETIGQAVMLTAKILQILNVIFQATAYLNALGKMKASVDKYLSEIASEIKKEQRFLVLERRHGNENVGMGASQNRNSTERTSLLQAAAGEARIMRDYNDKRESRSTACEIEEDKEEMLIKESEAKDNAEALRQAKLALVYQFKEETHALMKEKIGGVMRYTILEPLLNSACQKLLRCFGRFIRGKVRQRREAGIRQEVAKVLDNLKSNKDITAQVKSELRLELVRLCSLSRDPKTIAHVIEYGGPMGVESVQAFANKYTVIIEVDSDNPDVPKKYVPENGIASTKTLTLKHRTIQQQEGGDIGHWSSGSGEDNPTSDNSSSPDCLLDALRQELRSKGINADDVNRKCLAEFMRTDSNFKSFILNGWHHTYNALGGFGGARRPHKWKRTELFGDSKVTTMAQIQQVRQFHTENGTMGYREGENTGGVPEDKIHTTEDMGCVTKFATETIEVEDNGKITQKEVPKFVQAKITADNLKNYQNDKRECIPKKLRESIKQEAGQREGSFQIGHIIAWVLGGPALFFNFFAQSAQVNNGVDKSLVHEIKKWLRENGEGAEVEINTIIDREPGSTFPLSHSSHVIFRRNGETIKEACVKMVNDANYQYAIPDIPVENPQRRQNDRRRSPGA